MIKFLWVQIRALLGGGASYLFLGLGAALVFQFWQLKAVKADRQFVLEQRDEALAAVLERNSLIASQSQQFKRRVQTQKEQDNAQQVIQSVPDSQNCTGSAPIGYALDWLRERESPRPETIHD